MELVQKHCLLNVFFFLQIFNCVHFHHEILPLHHLKAINGTTEVFSHVWWFSSYCHIDAQCTMLTGTRRRLWTRGLCGVTRPLSRPRTHLSDFYHFPPRVGQDTSACVTGEGNISVCSCCNTQQPRGNFCPSWSAAMVSRPEAPGRGRGLGGLLGVDRRKQE